MTQRGMAPILETGESSSFFVLRAGYFEHPDECDGCGRRRAQGYTLVHVDVAAGRSSIEGWVCSVDCTRNVAAA